MNFSNIRKRTMLNNINRSLNILRINKIDVGYCLLSNISALLSKTIFSLKLIYFMYIKSYYIETVKIVKNIKVN